MTQLKNCSSSKDQIETLEMQEAIVLQYMEVMTMKTDISSLTTATTKITRFGLSQQVPLNSQNTH
jgi:hypothetical protein